jgi:hypothetical protein
MKTSRTHWTQSKCLLQIQALLESGIESVTLSRPQMAEILAVAKAAAPQAPIAKDPATTPTKETP